MTYDELHTQVLEIFDLEVRHIVSTRAANMIRSGAMDTESEPQDSFGLAKVVLAAALRDSASCFRPLSEKYEDTAKNLPHF